MRLILTFVMAFFSFTTVFAQTSINCKTLTLKQILTLTGKNLDDFDTYARSKCYYPSGTSDLDGYGEEHDYKFRNEEISNGDVVRLGIFSSDKRSFVAYLTISETKYNSLKSELASLGFKFINSARKDNITTMNYSSANYGYDLHINYIDKASKYKYNFSLTKK